MITITTKEEIAKEERNDFIILALLVVSWVASLLVAFIIGGAESKSAEMNYGTTFTALNSSEQVIEQVANKVELSTPELPVTTIVEPGNEAFDFDTKYNLSWDYSQEYIDEGRLTHMYGDFYHHNTADFMFDLWSLTPGDKVILGGVERTYEGMSVGRTVVYPGGRGYVIDAYDNILFTDGKTEIIVCAEPEWTGDVNLNRYVYYFSD